MSDTGIAGDQLRQYVERVERLEEEKSALAQDIRDVFLEAKGNGFDVKILKRIIAYRKKDRSEVQEEDAIFELYMHALGLN